MLNLLDNLLRAILMDGVPALQEVQQGQPPAAVSEDQVRFEPPDDQWRNYVRNTIQRNAFNVYLIDLRENRKLRSNERVRTFDQGFVYETPIPVRLDCHYLISAYS